MVAVSLRPLRLLGARVAVLAAVLVLWELYSQGISRALFAPPSAVVTSFQRSLLNGDLVAATLSTLGSLAAGLSLATIVGVAVGIVMGRQEAIEKLLDPYVSFFYALPTNALIPVFVVWVGVDTELRILLAFLSGVFIIIINTTTGVKQVDQEYLDLARAYCATERRLIATVVVPAALPFIFAGVRIALGQCLIGVIVAEMTTRLAGLGGEIVIAANRFRTADMLVPIVVVMAVGVTLTTLLRRIHRRATPWHIEQGVD